MTHRLSSRSVLFPTRKMITSPPRSVRTSWIHRTVLRNDARSAVGVAARGGRAGGGGVGWRARWRSLLRALQLLHLLLAAHAHSSCRQRVLLLHPSLSPSLPPSCKATTHWSHRTPPLPPTSPECSWGLGCGSAPGPPCPCDDRFGGWGANQGAGGMISPTTRTTKHATAATCGSVVLPASAPAAMQVQGVLLPTHQSCSRTVLSSKYMVLDRKSMPMVACLHWRGGGGAARGVGKTCHSCIGRPRETARCVRKTDANHNAHLVCVVKLVIHEPCNN